MLENPGSAILYTAATGLERSMADADAERLIAIEAEKIIDVWDPLRIDLPLLPYLAWAMGVNYWDDKWREITKRTWVAQQWQFKSLRGTLAGARMAIDYAGRDVSPFGYRLLKATTRPQCIFSGKSLTRQQREAWLADLPQLRVWRIQERGTAGRYKTFYGGHLVLRQHSSRFCLGGGAPTPSTAIERLKRRARWIVDGIETTIKVSEFGNYWRVHLPGLAGQRIFSKRPIRPNRFYIPSDAAKRLFTIAPTELMPWRSAIGPTLEPLTAEPERIVIGGMKGYSVFCDVPLSQSAYYVPTTAWKRIFQRFAINQDRKLAPKRTPIQFMGTGRFGFPKYTAWLQVSMRGQRSKFAAGDGIIAPRLRFWLPHDGRHIRRAMSAVVASKRLVDRILLKLGPVNRFVAGKVFFAGIDKFVVLQP